MQAVAIESATSVSKRTGEIKVHATRVSVWEERIDGHLDEDGMRKTFRSMLARLSARGWYVERDPQTLKNYPTIADYRWIGSKGDLRVIAETSGRTANVEFYQEINVDHCNGGRYVFDKFAKMPRHLRLACVVEMGAVVGKLLDLGYTLDETCGVRADAINASILHVAEDLIDARAPLVMFNKTWTATRFKRDETGWPTVGEYVTAYGSANDRDGAPMRNGDVKYFRRRGRLLRGTVYTNMNNMWMVVYGGSVTYVANWELFDCDRPDLEPRRLMSGQAKRVRAELEKAVKGGDYRRAAALAKACEKVTATEQKTVSR